LDLPQCEYRRRKNQKIQFLQVNEIDFVGFELKEDEHHAEKGTCPIPDQKPRQARCTS